MATGSARQPLTTAGQSLVRLFGALSGFIFFLFLFAFVCSAASFPGIARVQIIDSAGGLTVSNNQFSISCWIRISIPSGTNFTENMVILGIRPGGSENDPSAYFHPQIERALHRRMPAKILPSKAIAQCCKPV